MIGKYSPPFLLLLLLGCLSAHAQRLNKKHIRTMLDTPKVLQQCFTGFVLYDPQQKKTLFERYPDRYFTPASNTKLYTFYAASQLLDDRLPGLGYTLRNDSLIFWGTGYPLLLHPEFNDSTVLEFLANRKEKLFYYSRPTTDQRLGPGWSWSDYAWYYSTEKSKFPIYGNHVNFRLRGSFDSLLAHPPQMKEKVRVMAGDAPEPYWPLYRAETANDFYYYPQADTFRTGYEVKVPFTYSDDLFISLLEDALHKKIKPYQVGTMPTGQYFWVGNTDTLYRKMLQESDNFLAEQIMMMSASVVNDTLGINLGIRWVKDSLMQGFSDEPLWVDGSGLSRYNMFTPRTTVQLLEKLAQSPRVNKMADLLPAGGKSGTIRSWYGREGQDPYVFAKTGTLSNNHCLSGYLFTKSGKVLIFSFMHNHYKGGSSPTKKVMERILDYVHERY